MTQLLYPLIPGNTYHISMRVSRGNWTNQAYNCSASNKLGIRFTTYAYTNLDTPAINNFVQVYTDSIVQDTLNWVLLDWNYVPDSAYTNIYLGNFFDDNHTDTLVIAAPLGQFGAAYYFIDSLIILCISSNCNTGMPTTMIAEDIILYHSKTIFIKSEMAKKGELYLFNETGQLILNRKVNDNERINISELSDGFYLAVLQTASKRTYKKIIKY